MNTARMCTLVINYYIGSWKASKNKNVSIRYANNDWPLNKKVCMTKTELKIQKLKMK